MSYRIKFKEVGRNRLSWESRTKKTPTDIVLIRIIRAKKAVISRGIEVDANGNIYSGVRVVGAYEISFIEDGKAEGKRK